jgi:hypothetical protein
MGTIRLFLIKKVGQIICRIILFFSGLLWIHVDYQEDVDYKKWLGPDWKP